MSLNSIQQPVTIPFYTTRFNQAAQALHACIPRLPCPISYDYVPCEITLTSPTLPATFVIDTARVYNTYLMLHAGRLYTRKELSSQLRSQGQSGVLSAFPELYVYEVWDDQGMDGHVDYQLNGYLWIAHTGFSGDRLSFSKVQEAVGRIYGSAAYDPVDVDYSELVQLLLED